MKHLQFQAVMKEVVHRARLLFHEGLPLCNMVDRRLSIDLHLFSRGGMRVLDKIEQQRLSGPACTTGDRQGRASGAADEHPRAGDVHESGMTELDRSYAFCRHVARTQARNFYYSFLLLDKPQRDAMCADLCVHAALR